jgi:molecular chaperone GrpE (heat shock protein)
MFHWLRRLLGSRSRAPGLSGQGLPAESPPAWATPLLEAVQKSSRAQARLALQVEELERKLEGGFTEWRDSLAAQKAAAPGAAPDTELRWEELLDSRDLLEEAARLSDPFLASGLVGVTDRLDRFLAQAGLRRLAPVGQPPDGRLFRVVGTQPNPSLSDGVIARVIRAAVLRGEHLVREGEAITVRNQP